MMARCLAGNAGQSGQALAEGLVAAALLAVFWIALGWVGRVQDISMSAQHASGFAALLATRTLHPVSDHMAGRAAKTAYFSGPAHQWLAPNGRSLLRGAAGGVSQDAKAGLQNPGVSLLKASDEPLFQERYPGDAGWLPFMRTDWRGAHAGVAIAHAHAPIRILPFEPGIVLHVRRQVSILRDAGHAGSDAASQQALARARHAWRGAAGQSANVGRHVASVMAPTESGWRRPLPSFDWTSPWEGEVPAAVLRARPVRAHSGPYGIRRINETRNQRGPHD